MSPRPFDAGDQSLNPRQLERVRFIEDRLYWIGTVNSGDVVGRFGVSRAQGAQDVARYRSAHPQKILYDPGQKAFVAPEGFMPIAAEQSVDRFLALAETDDLVPGGVVDVAVLRPPPRRINMEVARRMIGAALREEEVLVSYVSMSSGTTERWLAPHALASDGHRYHVRCWDHRRSRFADFVLARVAEVKATRPRTADVEGDSEWFEMIDIDLVPNPALSDDQHRMVMFDYGFEEGDVLTHRVRKALLLYLNVAMLLHSELADMPDEHLYRPLVPQDQAGFDAMVDALRDR